MEAYVKTLAALADPMRLELVQRLSAGPRSVTELARGLPVTRPAVSQHLKVLLTAGLARQRADGTRRIYSLNPQALQRLAEFIDSFWNEPLARFEAAAKRRAKETQP